MKAEMKDTIIRLIAVLGFIATCIAVGIFLASIPSDNKIALSIGSFIFTIFVHLIVSFIGGSCVAIVCAFTISIPISWTINFILDGDDDFLDKVFYNVYRSICGLSSIAILVLFIIGVIHL